MGRYKRIPGDFGVIALSLEAQARSTSYGKLVAALTLEEREYIIEKWKLRLYGERESCSDHGKNGNGACREGM